MSLRGGFTLVELLVAVALGALLTSAVLASAAFAGRRHAELQEVARLHERGAHALGLLEPEAQLAGYGGLAPQAAWRWPAALPAGALACGTLVLPSPAAVRVDAAFTLACPAQGGGAQADSDVLAILRAGARLATPAPRRLQVMTSRRADAPAEVVLDGGAASPLVEGRDELHELELQSFYVSRNSDGQPGLPALRVKSLTAIDGRVAFVDRELVPGVEQLCIETAAGADGALTFQPGPAAFPASRLPAALRATLVLRGERSWGPGSAQAIACGARRATFRDGIARLAVTRTWALRNRSVDAAAP